MVVDDFELTLPECDHYISYVRHPDFALAIIEKQKPVILGVSFGPGFLHQAKRTNENIVVPVTICSLEDNTWVPEREMLLQPFLAFRHRSAPARRFRSSSGSWNPVRVSAAFTTGRAAAIAMDVWQIFVEPVLPVCQYRAALQKQSYKGNENIFR
ncbi:MAG: hypothetical protein A4E35_00365 [Methanoregula sp. PtaU1.Bin051]|nr:MAG: hypothetical protein A4E35_00365 [Methanoregula sp. PtaU1.Bin051]